MATLYQTYLLLILILIKKIKQKIFNEQLLFSLNMNLNLEGNNTVPVNDRNRGKRQYCGIKPSGERCQRHYRKGHEVGEYGIFLCWQHHDVLF